MNKRKTCHTVVTPGLTAFLFGVLCLMLYDPARVMASESATAGWGVWETIGKFFNLGLVVATLVYVLRKPLAQFFDERRWNIRRSLEEAEQARTAAEAKLAEMGKRMAALDLELKQIKEEAARNAEEESRRSAQLAEQESERIIGIARREADSLVRAATLQLRDEASRLAVELAEKKIQSEMGSAVDDRLVQHFIQQLGNSR